jgi:hypothetical protein
VLEGRARGGHRDAHGGGVRRERLVREPRHGVLLVQDVRDARGAAAGEKGHLDVGTKAHGHVGGTLVSEAPAHLALGAAHLHE